MLCFTCFSLLARRHGLNKAKIHHDTASLKLRPTPCTCLVQRKASSLPIKATLPSFIYVIHLTCWDYLADLITRTRPRKIRTTTRTSLAMWPPLRAQHIVPSAKKSIVFAKQSDIAELHLCHPLDVLGLPGWPDSLGPLSET